ncbi:MAG TPA: SusC/RagA family TonB-linked outer membrane protein [Gemmatimonadaceae bacterium]|nr:SusC/RagA family TonB-linked outer membrane protein [Gemmatimonadaceae bacterium]
MRRFAAVSLLLGLAAAPLAAQGREVTGRVTDAGGTPLTEATIGVAGAQVGVRTNERGEYRIRVPAGDVTLMARAIGFKRTEQKVPAGQSTANFSLDKDVLELEGVTVTGQATTVDKRNATTATATVSADELMTAPAKSVEGNLAGKVVGASIMENSGVPGGGMQIQIRGATSILASGDPLYVVDGVIISNASIAGGLSSISRASGSTASTQDQTVNRLADLNPNDIENIEVLKSAAATAIYGSRATNGVVVITTKKGKAGATHFNVTQRMGTQQATRLLGSRHFTSYAQVQKYLGSSAHADSIAKANCSPTCSWYDWQSQLYDNTSPSFETALSTSGGSGNTRYYGSLNDRQTTGVERNSGARLTSGHVNLDQTIGDKLTISGGADFAHSLVKDGIGNNDNAGISPIYTFGYAPAIYDLQKIDPATGRLVYMWMNGGGAGTSNPFDVVNSITNAEDTWRQMANLRVGYSLLSTPKNNLQLTYVGGVDRFQLEGNQYSPNYMQYEPADGFLGTSQILTADSRFINQSMNGVWTYTPGWSWLNSAQSSFGGTYETQRQRTYNIRMRGLTPTRETAVGGTDIATGDNIQEYRDQSRYFNEQVIAFGEKLALQYGIRADRSSANGDRGKYYTFPKYSASYRFIEPFTRFTSKIDEIKLRASFGESGNRPNYGVRDVTIASGGTIGGIGSLVAASGLGNTSIKPEVMNEQEYGLDGTFFHGRASLELTHYERVIKDLLVTFPLPPSSGLGSETVNGGQMSTRGFEGGLSLVPISNRTLEWTFRTTYQHNVQMMDQLSVPGFIAPGGSFGSAYGRNRIFQGTRPTYIWGNLKFSCINSTDASGHLVAGTGADGKPCHQLKPGETVSKSVTRDSIIADANPIAQISFLNTFKFSRFTVSGLLDWRVAGYTADMTNNLFDEGGNSADFDKPSPTSGVVMGDYRYSSFASGNISPYIQAGTFVKLRELNVTYQAPARFAQLLRTNDLRLSVQGRNLYMWSKYWSFDPEFNNFGNQNFNRFIDLAPYPSSRQFYISVDLGY